MNIPQIIAAELAVRPAQVEAAVRLLDEGATVPFVARYRKEVTDGLDDTQLRHLEARLGYLRELEERRAVVLASIAAQDRLTDALRADLLAADTRARLEDLYLPYKPKRRTKAQIAREAGLAPLAETLLADPQQAPETLAGAYVDAQRGVADAKAALDGARQILMETFAEDAELLGRLRELLWTDGVLASRVVDGRQDEGAKFSDYFDFAEPLHKVPSHRALALLRGRNEGVLTLALDLPVAEGRPHPAEALIAVRFGVRALGRPADAWLAETVRWAWKVRLATALDTELKNRLREAAETEAIRVFGLNLKDLLLAAPAGPRTVLGLDPGLRTGCKLAVVDATGKLLATDTIHPHVPHQRWDEALAKLAAHCRAHRVELIAIGNGTASRETDRLVAELIRREPAFGLGKVVVSEAGASVYSASEFAAQEFPGLDVSLRGAVSIARRLQDPLAELVKIEPKAIGVGQYQHDVNQTLLARTLDAVVEDCVNAVGVDVNTASVPLLTRVSGLSATLARNIVAWRDEHGAFRTRAQLLKVPRLGDKTFEQAAGFLRIAHGDHPLDRSAVHPEAYPVVERILKRAGRDIGAILGDTGFLRGLRPEQYTDGRFGVPTVRDIIAELEKPGRDPRPEFRTAAFRDGVEELKDLEPDMVLEGVVTNVTNFGAFVDVGVHQDGLVHVSCLSEKFVKDPHQVVRAGDVVRVKVLEVDVKRRRIALTMRLADQARDHQPAAPKGPTVHRTGRPPQADGAAKPAKPAAGAFADAFAKAKRK